MEDFRQQFGALFYRNVFSFGGDDVRIVFCNGAGNDQNLNTVLINHRTVLRADDDADISKGPFAHGVAVVVKIAVGAVNFMPVEFHDLGQRAHAVSGNCAKSDFSHNISSFSVGLKCIQRLFFPLA